MNHPVTLKRPKREYMGYLYILPWVIGLLIFQLYPFIYSFILSFTNKTLSSKYNFVGLKNYISMLTRDRDITYMIKATLIYILGAVPGRVLFALIIALLLSGDRKFSNFFRTAYYLPSIFGGSVAISIAWRFLFQKDGVINGLLSALGISPVYWLGSPGIALFTVILIPVWQFGSSMVLFLAAIKNVPLELYESATIDGSNGIRKFFSITLPMISPILLFNLIMQTINCFQEFSTVYVLTDGGPNRATYLFGLKLYNEAFTNFKMGYSSAISWFMFAIILMVTGIVFITSKHWVYYSDGGDL